MLLDFKFSNYKSFYDETNFSMTPAPQQTGLDYSILSEKIGAKKYRGLSSAVIYGPNASGKTNLIGAMDTMRAIVLRGKDVYKRQAQRGTHQSLMEEDGIYRNFVTVRQQSRGWNRKDSA